MQKGLKIINHIIAKEDRSSTYKLALLRAIIDIVQNHGNLGKTEQNPPTKGRSQSTLFENYVAYPFGLLIEKWIFYYFPLSDIEGTKSRTRRLNFHNELDELVGSYQGSQNFRHFFLEYKEGIAHERLKGICYNLAIKMMDTIIDQPMRYMGNKSYGEYQVCFPSIRSKKGKKYDLDDKEFSRYYLLTSGNFGLFYIPGILDEVFRYLGAYLLGTTTIIQEWITEVRNFQQRMGNDLKDEIIGKRIFPFEDEELSRFVEHVRAHILQLHKKGPVRCVLSEKLISSGNELAIDHFIPFSVMGNNDIWNLLPAHHRVNLQKSDRIPTPDFLDKRKDLILDYWEGYHQYFQSRFEREALTSLFPGLSMDWEGEQGFAYLQEKCRYLIDERGYEAFDYGFLS